MSVKKKKAPNLAAIMSGEVEKAQPEIQTPPSNENAEKKKRVIKAPAPVETDKVKKISTSVYIPLPVKEKLEEIQFSERKSGKNQNDLFLEGIDLLLKDRGFPSISELVKP